jgi:hypothetical protein
MFRVKNIPLPWQEASGLAMNVLRFGFAFFFPS